MGESAQRSLGTGTLIDNKVYFSSPVPEIHRGFVPMPSRERGRVKLNNDDECAY